MTEKLYRFRVNDEKLQNFLDSKNEISDYLRNLAERDMKGELTNKKENSKSNELKEKKTDAEIKLTYLKIWKELRELNAISKEPLSPQKILEIMNGNFEVPKNFTTFETPKQEEKEKKLLPDGFCEFCKHQHMSSKAGGQCSYWNCNCGVRG